MNNSYNNLFLKKNIEEFLKGNKKKSYEELKKFVLKNSQDSIAIYNLGLMAQELTKTKEAKKYYNESIKINQKNWQAKFNLYIMLIKEKNIKNHCQLLILFYLLKKIISLHLETKH